MYTFFSFGDRRKWMRVGTIVCAAMVLTACAASKHREEMSDFSTSWAQGQYDVAAHGEPLEKFVEEDELAERDLLNLLHLAEAVRMYGDDALAIAAYDHTEKVYRRFDEEGVVERGAGQLGAILLNDSAREYRGNIYEATLVNSYKGLSFLSMGKADLARVEFNRADDRTRRAVEFYAEEIEQQKQALAEEEEKEQEARAVEATLESDAAREALDQSYGKVSEWEVYPDFINPFVTYLHGLFFLTSDQDAGDVERARVSLERVAEMTDSAVVSADARLADGLATGELSREDLDKTVWVIYENGQGPTLEEQRFDLPIFLLTQGRPNRPTYAAIALPRIVDGSHAHQSLRVGSSQESLEQTALLSDMKRVVRTEFQHKFNGVLTRAIASAVFNMALQAEASDRAGLLGALAATAFTAATTEADLRIWRAMPDHWQVARFRRPKDGRAILETGSGQPLALLDLPKWPYTLVYVKQPSASAAPLIKLIDLQGKHAAIDLHQQENQQLVEASP